MLSVMESGSTVLTLDPSRAAEALATADRSRRRFALEQAHWPWSRHAVFGALIGGLAAAQAIPPPYSTCAAVALIGVAARVAAADRRRRGVFVSGWRYGRTLWVTAPMAAAAIAVSLLGLWLSREREVAWAPVAIGAALLPAGTLASKAWEQVYRRELQESL